VQKQFAVQSSQFTVVSSQLSVLSSQFIVHCSQMSFGGEDAARTADLEIGATAAVEVPRVPAGPWLCGWRPGSCVTG
jgi:hypothetical protein